MLRILDFAIRGNRRLDVHHPAEELRHKNRAGLIAKLLPIGGLHVPR
jgi:hypothetical protein